MAKAGTVTHIGRGKDAYGVLVRKPALEKPLVKPRSIWEEK
jgi:hypothetical protein